MPKVDIFLDSSALVAGIISAKGAARALLLLGEDTKIILTVSEQVITEVERTFARKAPKVLPFAREIILNANIRILRNPSAADIQRHQDWIKHAADISILTAAWLAKVDFLATLNTHHFIDDAEVAKKSGLRIGTPGDALIWLRDQLGKQ